MKCSLCCSHVSRLKSLVFLWPRRVYKGRCKTSPFRWFSIRLSYRFAWQAWHCDIPTCIIPCRKCQNWRKSRMKCSLCCSHVSRLECLIFLWPRRVCKGRCKTSPSRRFSIRLSYRFAWQAWHFVTFQHVLYLVESVKIGGSLPRNARFAAPTCLVSSLWFSCGLAVSIRDAAKPLLFEGFQAGCHIVLRGKRGPW